MYYLIIFINKLFISYTDVEDDRHQITNPVSSLCRSSSMEMIGSGNVTEEYQECITPTLGTKASGASLIVSFSHFTSITIAMTCHYDIYAVFSSCILASM